MTELASFRDVFVAGPRFKSLAIGILPSLFAQSLLAQEGFFALDTEPIPARQILLVHRGEGRTSLLCILTSSKRKKPCHIKALQMRRTPLFGKNAEKRSSFHYHSPITRCISRLTAVMPAQQQAPNSRGFPPLFTSLTTLLFSPIAAIAMMMKNLLSSFSG